MPLKSYLQALLGRFYSKTIDDQVEAAALSLPSGESFDQDKDASDSQITDVSPIDGFLQVRAKAQSVEAAWFGTTSGEIEFSIDAIPNKAPTMIYSLPVRKGASILTYKGGLQSLTYRFVNNVAGGGAKAHIRALIRTILRGGLPCLKISCRPGLKLFLRAKRATSVLRRSHVKGAESTSINNQLAYIQPLAMDILASTCKMRSHLLISTRRTMGDEKHLSDFRMETPRLFAFKSERGITRTGTETKSHLNCGLSLLREVNSLIATEVCHG